MYRIWTADFYNSIHFTLKMQIHVVYQCENASSHSCISAWLHLFAALQTIVRLRVHLLEAECRRDSGLDLSLPPVSPSLFSFSPLLPLPLGSIVRPHPFVKSPSGAPLRESSAPSNQTSGRSTGEFKASRILERLMNTI